jgi:hypothetical protein
MENTLFPQPVDFLEEQSEEEIAQSGIAAILTHISSDFSRMP